MQSRFAGLVLVTMIWRLIGEISGLSVTVKDVECIHEYAYTEGSPISGHFIVGGRYWLGDHPGIDFTVTSPSGSVVHSTKGSFGLKFELVAPVPGMYNFCFKNSYYKTETVTFLIHIGLTDVTQEHNITKNEHFGPLFGKIHDLKKALDSVQGEHKYLINRKTVYLWINESLRYTVLVYTIAEYVFLTVLSAFQIIYVRHLFKNK